MRMHRYLLMYFLSLFRAEAEKSVTVISVWRKTAPVQAEGDRGESRCVRSGIPAAQPFSENSLCVSGSGKESEKPLFPAGEEALFCSMAEAVCGRTGRYLKEAAWRAAAFCRHIFRAVVTGEERVTFRQEFLRQKEPGSARRRNVPAVREAHGTLRTTAPYSMMYFPARNTREGHTLNRSPLLRQELAFDGKNDDTVIGYFVNLWIFSRACMSTGPFFTLHACRSARWKRSRRCSKEPCFLHPDFCRTFPRFSGNGPDPVFMRKGFGGRCPGAKSENFSLP